MWTCPIIRKQANEGFHAGEFRVRRFDDHLVDARHIRRDGHAVIEEAQVLHLAARAEDICFIERPADAQNHAALELGFHLKGMTGLYGVLLPRIPDRRGARAPRLAGSSCCRQKSNAEDELILITGRGSLSVSI